MHLGEGGGRGASSTPLCMGDHVPHLDRHLRTRTMTRTLPLQSATARHHHIPRCSASSKRARASRVRRMCGAHHTARDNAAAAIHATARARSLRCMARRLRRAVQRLRRCRGACRGACRSEHAVLVHVLRSSSSSLASKSSSKMKSRYAWSMKLKMSSPWRWAGGRPEALWPCDRCFRAP
jgi:hypothetical protein